MRGWPGPPAREAERKYLARSLMAEGNLGKGSLSYAAYHCAGSAARQISVALHAHILDQTIPFGIAAACGSTPARASPRAKYFASTQASKQTNKEGIPHAEPRSACAWSLATKIGGCPEPTEDLASSQWAAGTYLTGVPYPYPLPPRG